MIVNPAVTYSYSQMMRDILGLQEKYKEIVSANNAGFSEEGRQLPVILLGNGKANLFLCSAHHAREYITSPYLMYTIDVYANAAKGGKKFGKYNVADLLKKCTLHIMPMVNPDGVRLVQSGLKAVKDSDKVSSMLMIKPSYSEWKANINGVDLNRQYPALWDKKAKVVNRPASELFNGYEPASEPEINAVMEYCKNYLFKASISFHTKGEVIYYSDENTDKKIPSAKPFAARISKVSGYKLMPVSEDPGVYAAGFENWFRQEFSRPALAAELTSSFGGSMPHNDKDFFSLVWKRAKYICAEAMCTVLKMD